MRVVRLPNGAVLVVPNGTLDCCWYGIYVLLCMPLGPSVVLVVCFPHDEYPLACPFDISGLLALWRQNTLANYCLQ